MGYKWKGLDVIRGLPRKSHKPRSEARLANEQAMKLIMSVLTPLKLFIRMGFRYAAEPLNMSAFNLALSINKKHAIKGQYPDLEIDWDNLQISKGNLAGIKSLAAEWTDTGLRVSWDTDTGNAPGHAADLLSLAVYSTSEDYWWPFFNAATRDAGECELSHDKDWHSFEAHVVGFSVSYTGDAVSDSRHVHVPARS
ncbi:hypothetical protein SAMN05421747_11574 [Parapedobacter composti]|uniref:Uncharacterized protein n=1 Tax=Parapedobacter composti TaxID=623281 RepID=A0A1I1KCE7_9SPHI|nr:hypothetical protein SAMN05421747_11574 [Parapedobacter composti]